MPLTWFWRYEESKGFTSSQHTKTLRQSVYTELCGQLEKLTYTSWLGAREYCAQETASKQRGAAQLNTGDSLSIGLLFGALLHEGGQGACTRTNGFVWDYL